MAVTLPVVMRTRLQEVALGMVLLGVIFSSLYAQSMVWCHIVADTRMLGRLFGIILTQTYKYYQRFKNDPPSIKLLVSLLASMSLGSKILKILI